LEDFINHIPIGIEGIRTLIFYGAFRFTGKTKPIGNCQTDPNQLKQNKRMLEPIKNTLPLLERSLEDA
jgi:DNA polymerase-3 subunit alpha/error-prone DNA polymerase